MALSVPEELGPYRLIRLLGRGGMGAVYLGEHIVHQEPVAIKILLAPLGEDAGRLERFESEIDTLRRLRHENVVKLQGYGCESGYRYFAMEYVDGPSLEMELRRHRRFTWGEAVYIGVHVSRALQHAHNRGIIHRDIKPANILLSSSGVVKVSDYGIAHLFGGERMTAVDTVIGTLDYMSPEQALSGQISPKSDLFSLGALLYVLLTEKPPFPLEKKSLPALLSKFREGPAESLRIRRPDIPRELDKLLLDLLQVQPEHRPANAKVVRTRFESILETNAVSGGLAGLFKRSTEPEVSDGVSRVDLLNPESDTSRTVEAAEPQVNVEEILSGKDLDEENDSDQTIYTDVLAGKTISAENSPGLAAGTEEGDAAQSGLTFEVAPSESDLKRPEADLQQNTSQYTQVSDEEFNPYASMEKSRFPSIRILLLSLALLMVGAFFSYALRRPSADKLYQKITSRLDSVSDDNHGAYISALRSLDDELDLFLSSYPNDYRADKVRHLHDDLDTALLETRLNRMAARSSSSYEPSLSLIEAAYLEAYRISEHDSEEGIRKFQAFLKVFGTSENDSNSFGVSTQCMRLARKRLAQLEQGEVNRKRLEQEFVKARLDMAKSLEETNPERAARIREGVKEFYGDRPWIGEFFQREE